MCAKMKGTRIHRNSEILESIGWQSFLRIQGRGIFPSWFFLLHSLDTWFHLKNYLSLSLESSSCLQIELSQSAP